ncbi:DUF4070 domain-containing protein [Synechococcales cyanobacterium C]|uniref:DUF4070 domain-containing protein n=1 Tax=Petrachloros mirabilis ULC683 TaxID=2781853 RepID=A0A8K2A0F4_9CYAN|nr:B12-binding domain-containing radical SAM protein [Petrachloros mirabilis]NCJ07467.1 DUF4070 domain-containing protein [Petrachloros mirabilis ULC683]
MRVLLLYPLFPKSFWSFERSLELVGRKALLPPLSLVTVAAMLPQTWEMKLVDRNVQDLTEADWDGVDLVILSAMIVQKDDFLAQIRDAKRRGKRVAVGGPYPTALPQDAQTAGVDYLILDEGEMTLPLFLEALDQGETHGVFRSTEKPDVTQTPVPRYDLLKFDAYDNMAVQFSRGCPFQCEFCDIIVLYGRKPRTKAPSQLLGELDALHNLGWRGGIFLVDDNFIGNKRNVKLLLQDLKVWQREHQYPFGFITEASVDLADDSELMELMLDCNFGTVFLGIETPDEDSLALTKKFQNTRNPLVESVAKINAAGLRIIAGFIIGFDGEKVGAGERVIRFVEQTNLPMPLFSMLQALPDTALWHRLKKEGRLLDESKVGNLNQTTLLNFIPTRPIEDIAREYVTSFWELYDPGRYLDRTYRHFMTMGKPHCKPAIGNVNLKLVQGILKLFWRQGVWRKTRWKFWHHLFSLLQHNPGVWNRYLATCAYAEHFLEYRQLVRDQIEAQLQEFLAVQSRVEAQNASLEAELREPVA